MIGTTADVGSGVEAGHCPGFKEKVGCVTLCPSNAVHLDVLK